MWLLIVFIVMPMIEIALFIQVGGWIGLWPTLLIVVLTALVGSTLMRRQGLRVLDDLRASMERGENPAGHMAHGALILVAGVLLLTPGFFTDALGLAFLIPPVRAQLIAWGASRVTVRTFSAGRRTRPAPPREAPIETSYDIIGETDPGTPSRPQTGSGWTRPDS